MGRGRKLIGGTVSVEVERQAVATLLLDGFFPRCGATDRPQRRRSSGFQEIGLPFESETAVTRHLAGFLGGNAADAHDAASPTHVLFNGGVFKADPLRTRVLETLSSWSSAPVAELGGCRDLDFAVARGAAYYGWTKQHGGVRIRGGIARSYYVGIETSGLAVPGAPRPLRALCVAPFGMEEGAEAEVPSGEIGLVLGEPAHFRFFSSPMRKQDQPGVVLERWDDQELTETDSLETTLAAEAEDGETYVPVKFLSRVTELGVFQLWCVGNVSDARWKLEFSVRDDASD